MTILLKALGWLTIISGIALGFYAGNAQTEYDRALRSLGLASTSSSGFTFIVWLQWTLGGLLSSVLWFALAMILEHVQRIEQRLAQSSLFAQPEVRRQARVVSTGDYSSGPTNRRSGAIDWPD